MMLLSKKLLFSTLVSQITNDFVWKSKAGNLLIYLNFCLATLSHNLRCKDLFDQILLKSEPFNPLNVNYLAIFCFSQLQDPQGGPCGLKNWSFNVRAIRVGQKHFRV